MERNWLGKFEGAEITFRVQGQRGETSVRNSRTPLTCKAMIIKKEHGAI